MARASSDVVDNKRRPLCSAIRLALLAGATGLASGAYAAEVFVNELHYDNAGTDTGEFVELAGPAGTDLTGWSLVLYNGSSASLSPESVTPDVT